MENLEQTIIAQYASSPTLNAWISSLNSAINPYTFWNTWYTNIWNVNSAVGYGLDLWGRVVGVTRNIAPDLALEDFPFRAYIMARALSNISNSSIPAMNKLIYSLFGAANSVGNPTSTPIRCYVLNNLNMSVSFVFEEALNPAIAALLRNTDALNRPAGVQAILVQYIPGYTFGFDNGWQTFGEGSFASVQPTVTQS